MASLSCKTSSGAFEGAFRLAKVDVKRARRDPNASRPEL